MVNGNGAFSPSLVPVVWLPLELLPAPEGFLLRWGGDRCVSVVPFQVVFSKWRFFHLSFIFFIHTRFIGSQSEGPAVKLCSAQFGLLGTPEIWQMQLDRKKPQSMSCFSSKGGDSSSHFRNNTCFITKFLCWQIILHFFSYQLMGVPNPQWQEDFVDQIPGVFSELHSLKAAALLLCGSEDSFMYCMVCSWVRLFCFPTWN